MRYRTISVFLSLLLIFGCSSIKTKNLQQLVDIKIPRRNEIKNIHFFPQEAHQCGPAALSMALAWSGVQVTPDSVAPEVFTPSLKGSLQSAIVGATRRHGRVAYPISDLNKMIQELAAGYPVIVLQNLGFSWFPIWHYSLVIGYDLTDNLIILHSGKRARKHLSLITFERTWARANHWGSLVLHPGILPVTVEENLYISAVIGLERAQRWREALKSYITALNKWPDNYTAHIGLGNCYYAMGDLKEAEVIFRGIILHFPNEGPAFNNLAQVLSDQGKFDEALDNINEAIRLEGPLLEQYLKTLKEIQIKKNTGVTNKN
jgi:hypothetical protein